MEALNTTTQIKSSNQKMKVNVNVLRKRIFIQKKKEKLQNRIILLSVFVSLGLIGYLVG
tara:strand:- start:1735 stop:1911 length:177 start_codon:yes stop_codon:yes gene_type:complete